MKSQFWHQKVAENYSKMQVKARAVWTGPVTVVWAVLQSTKSKSISMPVIAFLEQKGKFVKEEGITGVVKTEAINIPGQIVSSGKKLPLG